MQLNTLENASIVTRTSKSGNNLGQRIHFISDVPASQIRKQLKEKNPKMSNKELREKVSEVLTGKSHIAWVTHDAFTSAMRSEGFIPDTSDLNKKRNKATSRYVNPATGESATDSLRKKDEELAKLQAELTALKASFAEVVEEAAKAE